MKKIFLAALTSLALCGYSYAQDDDDEYEEEETTEAVKPAPAVEDEEEDEAPAPKVKKEKKKKKASLLATMKAVSSVFLLVSTRTTSSTSNPTSLSVSSATWAS